MGRERTLCSPRLRQRLGWRLRFAYFARDGTASIDGPTTLVNNGSLTLNSITVSANGLLQSSGLPVDVTGTLTVSGGGSFTSNSGLTLFGNLSVTGSLLANGQVIFADTTKMTGTGSKVFGDVLVTGVLTPNSIYTLTGDLVVADSGVVNAGTSTVTFNGNSSLRTIGTGTVTFNNITIADGKTLNAYSDFSIAGATMTWNGMLVSTATTTFSRTGITTLQRHGCQFFCGDHCRPGHHPYSRHALCHRRQPHGQWRLAYRKQHDIVFWRLDPDDQQSHALDFF